MQRVEPDRDEARDGRPLARALVVAVLCLLGFEAGASLLRQVLVTPSSAVAARNPHFRRGWVDYTAPPREPAAGRDVILVTASQGYLRESPRADEVYAQRLEHLLSNAPGRSGLQVHNWSIDGGSALEMVLLTARAVQHRPAILLLVVTPGVFRDDTSERLPSYWVSDTWELCHLSDVREILPDEVIASCDRERVKGWVATRIASSWLRSRLFDRQIESWRTWRVTGELATEQKRRRRRLRDMELDEGVLETTLRLVVEMLSKHTPETRLVVVAGPLARERLTVEGWNLGDRMIELARPRVREDDVVLDAREVVASERFYGFVHFDRLGHDAFADWLASELAPLLTP